MSPNKAADDTLIDTVKCHAVWSGRVLYIGEIMVASYHKQPLEWVMGKKWAVKGHVSCVKPDLGVFESESEAQGICMRVARLFVRKLRKK